MQNIFNPEPNFKREFTPHEATYKFVKSHFTTSCSGHARSVIQEECALPVIEDFMVLKMNLQVFSILRKFSKMGILLRVIKSSQNPIFCICRE